MAHAITLIVVALLVGAASFRIGNRLAWRAGAGWLVRPHTPTTLARMPLPEAAEVEPFSVSDGQFVRAPMEG